MSVATMPEMYGRVHGCGYDGRYRLWTAAHGVDFDTVPAFDDGGPSTTAINGWNVSTSTATLIHYSGGGEDLDDGQHTLSVWRGDPFEPTRHPDLDGKKFATRRDADRAAFQAGVVALFIPEKHAFQYRLPITITRGMDLGPLYGVRVRVARDVPGYGRSVHYGVFYSLWHSERLGDVGGMIREEPHGECRGGDTAFTMPYDTTIVTRA